MASGKGYPNWLETPSGGSVGYTEGLTACRPRGLLPLTILHYNPLVSPVCPSLTRSIFALGTFVLAASFVSAQEAPPASGARILLMPRKLITGERATLAVLDVNGRLTPGVEVKFSDGEKVTTDPTGRALFVAPLNPGTISAGITGRAGHVTSTILSSAGLSASQEVITGAPLIASIADRFELAGEGFCGDADANHVTVGGLPGLVLASSPPSLTVLPPAELEPGPAEVNVTCGQKAAPTFIIVFVSLELESRNGSLTPEEHRELVVRVRGTTTRVTLEAHNLSADVADLRGGSVVREASSGGTDNTAKFELVGKKHGNFTISIRLLSPLSPPRS
jgi:hypothetical protein